MFSTYHKFANRAKSETLIKALYLRGKIPEQTHNDFQKYHGAFIHKLHSCCYYHDQLDSVLNNTPSQLDPTSDVEFFYNLNIFVDGFFYTSGSALDILAREVLTCYGIRLPHYVYFKTAKLLIDRTRVNDPLSSLLVDPSWKNELAEYRNVITHELLVAGSLSINATFVGTGVNYRRIMPLPDNPRLDPENRTYRRNKDISTYCEKTITRMLSLVNQIYENMIPRIKAQDSMPL